MHPVEWSNMGGKTMSDDRRELSDAELKEMGVSVICISPLLWYKWIVNDHLLREPMPFKTERRGRA